MQVDKMDSTGINPISDWTEILNFRMQKFIMAWLFAKKMPDNFVVFYVTGSEIITVADVLCGALDTHGRLQERHLHDLDG